MRNTVRTRKKISPVVNQPIPDLSFSRSPSAALPVKRRWTRTLWSSGVRSCLSDTQGKGVQSCPPCVPGCAWFYRRTRGPAGKASGPFWRRWKIELCSTQVRRPRRCPPPLDTSVHIVNELYQTLLNRTPQQQEVNQWVVELQEGLTPAGAAAQFLGSPEYLTNRIRQGYEQWLGRAPEPQGEQSWLVAMQGGLTQARFTVGVLASPEYLAQHGGPGPGWLTALYHDVLDRSPDPSGLRTPVRREGIYPVVAFVAFPAQRYHVFRQLAAPSLVRAVVNIQLGTHGENQPPRW
jgi:Domain of unknown function (DUF4214)